MTNKIQPQFLHNEGICQFIVEIQLKRANPYVFIQKPAIDLYINEPEYEFLSWGDPISNKAFNIGLAKNPVPDYIVNNLYGHYYYILLNKISGVIFIGNSMFSILPLYYSESEEKLVLSNNALYLSRLLGLKKVSRRFILEMMLFNYPLFNESIVENIMLLPSNSFIKAGPSGCQIQKHTRIENYYSLDPKPWQKSTEELSDVFLEKVQKYLPSGPYFTSLTGGFDSRTLTAVSLLFNKQFECFGFGSQGSKDTSIGKVLANKAGLTYKEILLNNEYVENHNLDLSLEFLENTSGSASFVRAHYLYAAKILSEERKYIVTGNFGSELFRAAHIRGVVFSPDLITLFSHSDLQNAIVKLETSDALKYLNNDVFKDSWDQLKNDLLLLPCFNSDYKSLTQNQRFYVYVFEEVFRKYFGAEMLNQFIYIKNRTPYLDIEFMKEMFKTELAGIHSSFFEHNPLKRFKGQVLYASILKKSYPQFGKIISDKGYKPDDLLTTSGKLNILINYIKKIRNKRKFQDDPFMIRSGYKRNMTFYKNIPVDTDLFSHKLINDDAYKNPDGFIYKVIGLSFLKDAIEKH